MAKINKPDKYANPPLPPQMAGQITQTHHYESAYLPASEAERYEQIHQGFIKHLMDNVEKETVHRHSLENKVQNAHIIIGYIEAAKRLLSPIIAGITILAFSFIVFYGYKSNHATAATSLAGTVRGIIFALRWLDSQKSK